MKYNYTRKPNGEAIITTKEFLRMLSTEDHGWGYNHLTTWSSLCKMLEPVAVPGDENKHRMLHLGAAVNMNDENDKRCGKRVFFTSFSFGPTENISMWTNYGIPNEEAVRLSMETKTAWFWSRSRQKLWIKGETSGHFQYVRNLYIDCDKDTLLYKIDQTGAACHTGNRTCFYTELSNWDITRNEEE